VLTDYNLLVIPMFILMGAFASHSGMSRELFDAGRAWFGHRRGGLAYASIAACGGFAAINGSSVATAATMSQVALPEMRKAGYDPGFSAGLIAAGGTLGIMIPPSTIFVLYGIMTEVDIARSCLPPASMPGLMGVMFYFRGAGADGSRWRRSDMRMPLGEIHTWAERFLELPEKPLGRAAAVWLSCWAVSTAACSRCRRPPAWAPPARC
jgi:C4-dicarboxylate transporter DctM subunit